MFYKDHPDKPTATSLAINTAPLMARLTVKPVEPCKQKQGRPANSTKQWAIKWTAFEFYRVFGWIQVTSNSDIISHIVRDCTWLLADRFCQNFYFSTSSSLSHKAFVFFFNLPSLGWQVFHQQPSLNSHQFPSSVSCHRVRSFFTNNMILWDSSASLQG